MCVRLLAELRSQQGGPADTDGRALGISLRHGIFRLSLEPGEFDLGIGGLSRSSENGENEDE